MSYDRKIEQVCTHEVIDEALFLNADRVTVRPLRPIANIGSVRLRLNGLVDVPASGLAIAATAKSSKKGPFNFQAGVNDILVVSVDGGPDQATTVPAGNQVSASDTAKHLNMSVSGAFFKVGRRGQVQGCSRTQGLASRLQIKSTSTAASTLGFVADRLYRGQQVAPRWSVINDPNTLSDRPTRLLIFDEQIRGTNDFVEISYNTVRQECRRCGGSGVENDWRYNRRGDIIEARNTDLLMQEVLKVTYTERGSNPFHGWYGTNILDSIGKKLSDRGLIQNFIVSDIRDAFRRWQSIKKSQEEVVGQFVSDEEYPFRLLVVNLEQDDDDPTVIYVNALVQSRASQPIQVSRGLKLPIPFDLLGSSVQDSLLRTEKARSTDYFR